MEQAAPLFSLGGRDCLICCKPFENYPVVQFTDKGWPSIQDNALKWKHINVPVTDPCFLYPTVCERIEGKNAFGGAHKSCRITFGTKSPIYEKRFGLVQDEKPTVVDDEKKPDASSSSSVTTRRSVDKVDAKSCFVCNTRQEWDFNPYNDGGLGQPKKDDVIKNLKERTKVYLADQTNDYHEAASRFVRQTDGLDGDAGNIYYHQSCYIRYTEFLF